MFPLASLLSLQVGHKVRLWGSLQWYNVRTKFHLYRSASSKIRGGRPTHRHHGVLISLPFSLRKESMPKMRQLKLLGVYHYCDNKNDGNIAWTDYFTDQHFVQIRSQYLLQSLSNDAVICTCPA